MKTTKRISILVIKYVGNWKVHDFSVKWQEKAERKTV